MAQVDWRREDKGGKGREEMVVVVVVVVTMKKRKKRDRTGCEGLEEIMSSLLRLRAQ